MRKVNVETLPLNHELRLTVRARALAEVAEVHERLLELPGVDLVAPVLGVTRDVVVDVLDLKDPRGRLKDHGAAREALGELLQLQPVGGPRERRAGRLLELPRRDGGHRGLDGAPRATLREGGEPVGLRCEEGLDERRPRDGGAPAREQDLVTD